MHRLLTAFLAVCLFGACPETEMKISGLCRVTGPTGATLTAPCVLETMTPREGFNNLYRVVLQLDDPTFLTEESVPVYDFVKAQNFEDGSVALSSILWGSVAIKPSCEGIRASIASRAPEFEVRPQTLFLSMLNPTTMEIRIEERWGEFYDGKPSPEWTARHLESFLRLSRAK